MKSRPILCRALLYTKRLIPHVKTKHQMLGRLKYLLLNCFRIDQTLSDETS